MLAAGLSAHVSAVEPVPAGASAPRSPRAAIAATHGGPLPAAQAGWVSVWVDLDVPELASLPREQRAEREALRLKIQAQQREVMARLRDLGAIEQARVQQVRNALAVRLPGAQLDAARHIPGVRAVRMVRHIDRGPLVHGD
jgi:hypothetical protein